MKCELYNRSMQHGQEMLSVVMDSCVGKARSYLFTCLCVCVCALCQVLVDHPDCCFLHLPCQPTAPRGVRMEVDACFLIDASVHVRWDSWGTDVKLVSLF